MQRFFLAATIFLSSCVANATESLSPYEQELLCLHDVTSAKLIIVQESRDAYVLAKLLLKRSSNCTGGEVEFYSAVVSSRLGDFDYGSTRFVSLMKISAESGYPLAIAQLYKLGTEGYSDLGGDPDYYKKRFDEEKSKNKDEFPEFDHCLSILKKMLRNGH